MTSAGRPSYAGAESWGRDQAQCRLCYAAEVMLWRAQLRQLCLDICDALHCFHISCKEVEILPTSRSKCDLSSVKCLRSASVFSCLYATPSFAEC